MKRFSGRRILAAACLWFSSHAPAMAACDPPAGQKETTEKPAAPAEQFRMLSTEFNRVAFYFWSEY